MKKILITILCLLVLTGCTSNETKTNNETNNNSNTTTNVATTELKDPVIEWCQLYNPNGFDTITCLISNPNSVDIDITYDLVFYKDGKVVSKAEDYANFEVSNKHNDVIWANHDIPKASDVDEVKMENIRIEKSYYNSIDADINYVETIGNQAYFSVKTKKQPTLNNIYVFLYNDNNNNKKCDKGELVIAPVYSVTEKDTKISVDTDVVGSVYGIDYKDYDVYYNAY